MSPKLNIVKYLVIDLLELPISGVALVSSSKWDNRLFSFTDELQLSVLGVCRSDSCVDISEPPTDSALSVGSIVLGNSTTVSSSSSVGSGCLDFPSRLLYASAVSDKCLNHL